MTITIRYYRDDDLDVIVDLTNAADAVDLLDEGTGIAELREILHRPGFDPRRDALVALDERQRIVGFARLELKSGAQQTRLYVHTTVHPHWREKGVERLLLQRFRHTAQERRQILGSKPVQFRTYCAAHQQMRIALFESFGLRPVRYSPHMVCFSLDNLADPRFPPGLEVRLYVRGQDDQSALEAINEAFADVMDFAPATLEGLRHWMASSSFREELSPVALDGEVVVGLCLCTASDDGMRLMGRRDVYVDALAVRPPYRRRGLGSALLLSSLHAMKEAGMESASLDTDTDNLTEAIQLYEKVGFREAWRWVTYGKGIP
ncbi:MAG: GNAT family N-acetyltransferase [Anaerolineae bacterium]|nr:GNAT family N-acetyltransferase [Anaerolineae bacterium]NIN94782.1 GNAT family N-acetyltransferase [Anaerolineae bacterium]NIQ77864.1 GNAT family N-acetyltransferase [Anaerolineae bacterium]